MDLIKFVPDSKEDALGMLAEFIEDCEFTKLAYVDSFCLSLILINVS